MKPTLQDIFSGSSSAINQKPTLQSIFGGTSNQPTTPILTKTPEQSAYEVAQKNQLQNNVSAVKDNAVGLFGDWKKRANNIADVFSQGMQGKTLSPSEALVNGAKIASEATGGITDVFTRGFKTLHDIISNDPDVQQIAGTKGIGAVLDAASNVGEHAGTIAQPVLQKINQWEQENPKVSSLVRSIGSTALNVAPIAGAPVAENVIKESAGAITDAAGNVINKGVEAAKSGIQEAKAVVNKFGDARAAAQTEKQFTNSIDEAKDVLNPSDYYTPTEKQAALQKGNIVKTGKGVFAKEKIIQPTTPQTEAVAELVNKGKVSAKNLPSQNIDAIKQEVRATDSEIDNFVSKPELNTPYNGAMINKTFDNVFNSAKKDLVFVADSTEQKAYQAVIDVAKEEINQQPKNLAGLRTGIKAFNARMEKILGSDIYEGGSESVGNARLTAAKDVRSSLNKFVADNLENTQKNNALRAMSSKETAPLIERAKKFDNPDDFIKDQYNTLARKRNFSNPAEYNTTVEEDLKDIWDTAHTRVEGGGNSIYMAQLRKEAQLLNASDEIAYRASKTLGKSAVQKFLKRHPLLVKGVGTLTAGYISYDILKELGL